MESHLFVLFFISSLNLFVIYLSWWSMKILWSEMNEHFVTIRWFCIVMLMINCLFVQGNEINSVHHRKYNFQWIFNADMDAVFFFSGIYKRKTSMCEMCTPCFVRWGMDICCCHMMMISEYLKYFCNVCVTILFD